MDNNKLYTNGTPEETQIFVVCIKKHDIYKCTYIENKKKANDLKIATSHNNSFFFNLHDTDIISNSLNKTTFMNNDVFLKRYSNNFN